MPTTTTTTTVAPTTTTTTPAPIPTYYVNINEAYDGGGPHAGTDVDPYDYSEFYPLLVTSSDTFYITGSRVITTVLNSNNTILKGWNGPWRISSNNPFTFNHVSDAIIVSTGTAYITNNISNCVILATSIDTAGTEPYINGCSLYGNFEPFSSGTVHVKDCIVKSQNYACGGAVIFDNCVFGDGNEGMTYNNCQFNWTPIPEPAWDAERSAFSSDILSVGIEIPPQPGNPPYTDYETGLWGTPRTGIGAMDFPALTTTTTTTEAPTTTTAAPTTTTTTTVAPILPPVIDIQPISQKIKLGETLRISVTASGSGILHYQWKQNGGNVGLDNSLYTKTRFMGSDAGSYVVVVTNDAGSVTSNTVTVSVLLEELQQKTSTAHWGSASIARRTR